MDTLVLGANLPEFAVENVEEWVIADSEESTTYKRQSNNFTYWGVMVMELWRNETTGITRIVNRRVFEFRQQVRSRNKYAVTN